MIYLTLQTAARIGSELEKYESKKLAYGMTI